MPSAHTLTSILPHAPPWLRRTIIRDPSIPPDYAYEPPKDNPPSYQEAVFFSHSWFADPMHTVDPTRPSPRLPPELTDRVLDFLHDDTRTLNACSTVSKSWLASTRLHRFRMVHLADSRRHIAFGRLLAQFPAVLPFIRAVRTSGDDICSTDSHAGLLPSTMVLYADNFAMLRDALPRLPQPIDLSMVSANLPHANAFTNVRALTLEACHLPAFTRLAEWLCVMPGLESVHLSECDIRAEIGPPPLAPVECVPVLRKVALDRSEFSSSAVVEALLKRGIRLEALMILPITGFELGKWQRLLEAAGPSLKQIAVSVLASLDGKLLEIYQTLLASCKELHTLHFISPALLNITYRGSKPPLELAPAILQHALPRLERIVISLAHQDLDNVHAEHWRGIAGALRSVRYPSFCEVVFQMYSRPGGDDSVRRAFRGKIEQELAGIAALGALSFKFSDKVTVSGIFESM